MELARLKTFRVVAEMLSFRKAALELHLTQPAITAQIKALEESLGVALFSRVGRAVGLTPAGETLLVYAHRMENLNNEAVAALSVFGIQQDAEFRVGASHTLAVHLLPKLLPALIKAWPKVQVHVFEGSSSDVLQALSTHRIKVGLIEAKSFRPDLKIEPFGQDELVLIVPSGHRWAERTLLSPAELADEPMLLREPGSGMRRSIEEYLDKNGVRPRMRSVVTMTSIEAIIAGVEAGIGIGFVPYLVLDKPLVAGSVKIISVQYGPILRPFSFVLHEGPDPQGPIQHLLELLRHAMIPTLYDVVARAKAKRETSISVRTAITPPNDHMFLSPISTEAE